MQGGQLYRVILYIRKGMRFLFISKTRKQESGYLMVAMHIGPAGNHEGRDRTHAKNAQKYFGHAGLSKDVRIWVSIYPAL